MSQLPPRKPEVMSPAGYWPQLRAAIEAGADAVYFGLKHFTARAKVGFSLAELPDALGTLHQRGVKGYVTFNTLVFDHELSAAARALADIAEAGADAIIVQDVAVAQLARQIAPELEVHASTQMSVTSADGVRLAQRLGAKRVTLARELSLEEVRAIHAETDCELEIFVHGALCVAYSGQCFSSEAWGGRSANRGQCAQACRLPYEMLVDGNLKPLGDARYLLSPGDLYALDHVPEIVRSGVSALKIEGRYKDAEYVALATRAYRKAVDEAWAGAESHIGALEKLQLEQVYSRGLGPYFVAGTDHQAVVRGRAPRHRGLWMGRVTSLLPDAILIETTPAHEIAALKPGDGIVFDAADWRSPEEPEEGGRIYETAPRPDGKIELRFANGALNFTRIRPGDLIWRTHDPDLDKVARAFLDPAAPVQRQPVTVHVTAREGEPLATVWTLAAHPEVSVRVRSAAPLAVAQNRAITADLLREQFGRLGGTPYELAAVELDLSGLPFAPSSMLNQLRREAVEQLRARQAAVPRLAVHDPAAVLAAALDRIDPPSAAAIPTPQLHLLVRTPDQLEAALARRPASITLDRIAPHSADETPAPQLHLLVRTPDQLEAALARRPASITLDYLDLYGMRPSVDRVKSAGLVARVAAPRIFKPGEERILDFLLSLDCPILVRSAGLVDRLRGHEHPPLIGDFSLNAANALAADLFLQLGLSRLTPTHDLNADQVTALAREIGAGSIEAVVFQHLPVFHTEHCVFARFLSTGTSFRDCGRPCERHRVALRDPAGRAHPVLADVGCRNTVFGAEAQQAALHLGAWREAGIDHFRLEFAHESAEQVTRITRAFEDTLSGRKTSRQLDRELAQAAPQGVTEGSLFVPPGYLSLPVLQ